MNSLRVIFRSLYINWIFAKHGLDELILRLPFFAPIRFLAWLNPWNWFRTSLRSEGERIRLALETLGPIFVKFGQMLSTRRDIIPEEIAIELAKLQDQVPPFSSDVVRVLLTACYGQPPEQIFKHFEEQPLASASVAQVHAAILKSGEQVVIKVLRPNIEEQIKHDVAIMYAFAYLAEKYWPDSRRFKPCAVVKEFARTLYDELDLSREAANASQLRRNFTQSNLLYVPEIYWAFTRREVLVMEHIYGIPISDLHTLQLHQVNLKKLAEHGVEIFFTQVFRDCFFHADMHPGNVFVNIDDPENPIYTAVDFGIMGSLNPIDQRYLAENLLAFFKRDYRKVAELHVASGWVSPHTRIDVFEAAIRTVCEPIFERPLKDISCAQLLIKLFETAEQFDMTVQPQLLLLQKTLLNIEGLGRDLYPELDLWHTAKPYLERWLKRQYGSFALMKKIIRSAPHWLEKLPEIPNLVYDNLTTERYRQLERDYAQHQHKLMHTNSKKHSFWRGVMVSIMAIGLVSYGLVSAKVMTFHWDLF